MRLFVALAISEEVRERMARLMREFRGLAPEAKWVRAENLHVTLKFLGETPADKLAAICGALRTVRTSGGVELRFRGLGFFPNERRAKVFWAGVSASDHLPALTAAVERRLAELGIPAEQRQFAPHVTLARFESNGAPPKFNIAVARNPAVDFGTVHAREFHLIESKLKTTGAEYTTLQSFPIAAED